jgi:MGT family glycosyltransferase
VPDLAAWARAEAFDAMVVDPWCAWGIRIAEIVRNPAITLCPTFAMHERSSLMVEIKNLVKKTWLRPPPLPALWPMARVLFTTEMLHLRYGAPRMRLMEMLYNQELNIVPVPREFQPDAELFDDRYHFVGPMIAPRPHRAEPWLEALPEGRTLYLSLGTVLRRTDLFRRFYEAFGGTDWQVVFATGGRDFTGELGPAPSNVSRRPERGPRQITVSHRGSGVLP